MKRILYLLISLFIIIPFCAIAQNDDTTINSDNNAQIESADNKTSSNQESDVGFGLQSEIFRTVQQTSTNVSTNISNMRDYRLTSGDIFKLMLEGDIPGNSGGPTSYTIQLKPDKSLEIPYIGTLSAEGLTFEELQRKVITLLKEKLPVQFVNFYLEAPAQFNVMIHGGVMRPGFITATSLTRITDAIAMSGGFKPGASYRNIQLIRDENTKSLDISLFYKNADLSSNPYLRPGDKLYIPQAKTVVELKGEVYYPGTYELKPDESVYDLIMLAGGFRPGANKNHITLQHMNNSSRLQLKKLSLEESRNSMPSMGDSINVSSAINNPATITLTGAVYSGTRDANKPQEIPTHPITVEIPYKPGLTLITVLDQFGGPTPLARKNDSYVERGDTGNKVAIEGNKIWEHKDSDFDIELNPGDTIVIPMQPMKVYVTGEVENPGAYDFVKGYTVEDYIKLSGGILKESASKNFEIIQADGKRQSADLSTAVELGNTIYVPESSWTSTKYYMGNFLTVTGWVSTLIALTNSILDLLSNLP